MGDRRARAAGARLRETAFPFLEDLFLATTENVLLAVRDEVVFVERLSAPGTVPVLTFLGRRRSLHASSAGLVLLAHAERELQEEVLARPLRRYTPATITDPGVLRHELDRIRRCGHVVAEGHMSLTAMSVAAPIRGGSDAVAAALTVVRPVQGADARTLVPVVVAAARGVAGAPERSAPRAS